MLSKLNHKGLKLTRGGKLWLSPICIVIMVIVKRHNLHTLLNVPMGRAYQGQHAVVLIQTKVEKKKKRKEREHLIHDTL